MRDYDPNERVVIHSYVTAGGTHRLDPPVECTAEEAQRLDLRELRRRSKALRASKP